MFFNILDALVGITWFLLPVWLVAAIFRRSRRVAGFAVMFSTYAWGAWLWITSVWVVQDLWGWGFVLIGLIFAGIGVLPLAIAALLFNGQFSDATAFVLIAACVIVGRIFSAWLITKADNETEAIATTG